MLFVMADVRSMLRCRLNRRACVCTCQIGEFYSKESFGLELGVEFWCPSESLQHTSLTGSFLGVALQRPPHKQVCTFPAIFVLSICEMLVKIVVLRLQKYVHQMCVLHRWFSPSLYARWGTCYLALCISPTCGCWRGLPTGLSVLTTASVCWSPMELHTVNISAVP